MLQAVLYTQKREVSETMEWPGGWAWLRCKIVGVAPARACTVLVGGNYLAWEPHRSLAAGGMRRRDGRDQSYVSGFTNSPVVAELTEEWLGKPSGSHLGYQVAHYSALLFAKDSQRAGRGEQVGIGELPTDGIWVGFGDGTQVAHDMFSRPAYTLWALGSSATLFQPTAQHMMSYRGRRRVSWREPR